MTTKQRILELIELEQKATPRPWNSAEVGSHIEAMSFGHNIDVATFGGARVPIETKEGRKLNQAFQERRMMDRTFTCQLRNEAPALLREHLRLLEIEEAARALVENQRGSMFWTGSTTKLAAALNQKGEQE